MPWEKGWGGVKWVDLDEATINIGFIPWLTRSYTIKLRHRYTKENEIVLEDVHRGNEISALINQYHMHFLAHRPFVM